MAAVEFCEENRIIGAKVFRYCSVDSTMNIARDLARDGEAEGTVVAAEFQKQGRGRLGREWVSPDGKGLYLSVILRPKVLPSEASWITLLAGIAMARAVRRFASLNALIKWPNDILINQKKAAGILTEMEVKQGKVDSIVVGMGVNVNALETELPETATSLRIESGREFDKQDFARKLFGSFEEEYLLLKEKKFALIREHWRKLSGVLGQRVRVSVQNGFIEGRAMDIDEQGALVVRLDNGLNEYVIAGEVGFADTKFVAIQRGCGIRYERGMG